MDWICYVEPTFGGDRYVILNKDVAIKKQKEIGRLKGISYSDADALDDFMVNHWAWFCESPMPSL